MACRPALASWNLRSLIASLVVITTLGVASVSVVIDGGACTGGEPSRDNESACDHCVACVVAHGHHLAVQPVFTFAVAAVVIGPLLVRSSTLQPDLLAASIFHPPLL
ncbi:MAG: hypothetical protein U0166_01085 [Acidobacteriota bacterium]